MSPVKFSNSVQFHHENMTWGRVLEYIKQENSILKNRLSEVLDTSTDRNFLALAEQYQNKFILKDEYIDELRHDINQQDKALSENSGGPLDNKLLKRHEKLRNEMEFFETDFHKLKNDFNKYLSTVL
jgi:hypothetical protein